MKCKVSINLFSLVKWLRSYQAPLLGLIVFTAAVVFHSEQIFIDAYPESMPGQHKIMASFGIALAFEFLIIVVTVNYEQDNEAVLNLMFLIYLVITSYFLETYIWGRSIGYYLIRAFMSLLVAGMARTYADILVKKLKSLFDQANKVETNKVHRDKIDILEAEKQKLLKMLQTKNKELESLQKRLKQSPGAGNQMPIVFNN